MRHINFKPKSPLPTHISSEMVRRIAWPMYKVYAYTPRAKMDGIDSLQRLYLQVFQMGPQHWSSLNGFMGFDKELIGLVYERCVSEGYLDESGLTARGKKILDESEVYLEDDERLELITLFRDGITGELIPYFETEELRFFNLKDDDEITIINPIQPYRKPKPSEVVKTLRMRNRVASYLTALRDDKPEMHQVTEIPPDLMEEVDWQLVGDDGELEAGFRKDSWYLQEEEREGKPVTADKAPKYVRIDDQPEELIFIETRFYFDPDEPDSWYIQSPFDAGDDWWYARSFSRASRYSEFIHSFIEKGKQAVEVLLSEARIEIEENSFEIIRQISLLRTNELLLQTKRQVISFERAKARVDSYDDNTDTYYLRAQKVIEAVLDACIRCIPNLPRLVASADSIDFRNHVERVGDELGVEVPVRYRHQVYVKKVKQAAWLRAHGARERALALLFAAYYGDDHSAALSAFNFEPLLLVHIDDIVVLRNQVSHSGTYDEIAAAKSQKEQVYVDLKLILTTLITSFFEGMATHGENQESSAAV